MSKERVTSDAQKALVLDPSGENLLVVNYLTSKWLPQKLVGKVGLPGGRIKPGETRDDSLIREVREETGITIIPGRSLTTWEWSYRTDASVNRIIATARIGHYASGEISLPSTEEEVVLAPATWAPLDKLEADTFVADEWPTVKWAISDPENFWRV